MNTLINGQPLEVVSSADRGLQYGDGLFETISCVDAKPRWLALHLQRLQQGCARLALGFDAFGPLRAEVLQLAAAQPRCIIKVIVTRGPASVRGYRPSGAEAPTRIVSRHPWPAPTEAAARGFRVGISTVSMGENPLLAGIKHLNRLEQVLAQIAARESGMDEVLLRSNSGSVISGSASNVFLLEGGALVTPALDRCGVAGIMRSQVLQAAAAAGIAVRERVVALAELSAAQELFLSNVRWGLQAVRWLDGRELPQPRVVQKLRELIDATPT